jgi:hypothetical protein
MLKLIGFTTLILFSKMVFSFECNGKNYVQSFNSNEFNIQNKIATELIKIGAQYLNTNEDGFQYGVMDNFSAELVMQNPDVIRLNSSVNIYSNSGKMFKVVRLIVPFIPRVYLARTGVEYCSSDSVESYPDLIEIRDDKGIKLETKLYIFSHENSSIPMSL